MKEKIIEYLRNNPNSDEIDVSNEFNILAYKVYTLMQELIQENRIKQIVEEFSSYYVVI